MDSINNKTILPREGFQRFEQGGMCPSTLYTNFLDGLLSKFSDAVFFANFLQFVLVALMYYNVGKGKYWKILYYAAISGVCGKFIESGTVAYVCAKTDVENPRNILVPFLLAEPFWIIKEFAVPFLNLIKIQIFSNGNRINNVLKYSLYGLFVLFCGSRFYIGYERMIAGALSNPQIKYGHMVAYAITGVADIVCTTGIIYFVNKNNKQDFVKSNFNRNNINHYIERSSYLILVLVDVVSIFLSVLNGVTEIYDVPNSYISPFLSIKSAFILILACDSVIFKYSVNASSNAASSNNYGNIVNSKNMNNSSNNNNNNTNSNSNNHNHKLSHYNMSSNKSFNDYTIEVPSNPKSNPNRVSTTPSASLSASPYSFATLTYDVDNNTGYKPKTIIKNYTNINTSSLSNNFNNDMDKAYRSQSFGYLS